MRKARYKLFVVAFLSCLDGASIAYQCICQHFFKKCGQIVLVNVMVNDTLTTKTLLAAGGGGIRRTISATGYIRTKGRIYLWEINQLKGGLN